MRALEIAISYTEYLEMPALLAGDLMLLAEGQSEQLKRLSAKGGG